MPCRCISISKADTNIKENGWDGRVLMCEEMFEDAPPAAAPSSRRLLDSSSGDYGSTSRGAYGSGSYGSGSRDLPGGYGDMSGGSTSRDTTFPAGDDSVKPQSGPNPAPMESTPMAMSPAPAPMTSNDEGGCDNCRPVFEQCGGGELKMTACCVEGSACIKVRFACLHGAVTKHVQ